MSLAYDSEWYLQGQQRFRAEQRAAFAARSANAHFKPSGVISDAAIPGAVARLPQGFKLVVSDLVRPNQLLTDGRTVYVHALTKWVLEHGGRYPFETHWNVGLRELRRDRSKHER